MSIYYFVKERFPRKDKRVALRLRSEGKSTIEKDILADDKYFTEFQLALPESVPQYPNRYHKHSYSSLDDDHQKAFDLRTIRHIIVRQVGPAGDAAMYEIFNRLNSGGINLTPQEIRRCTFDSAFYDMLYRPNTEPKWRKLVGRDVPDIHMKDVEILLRGFAMLINENSYRPSMVSFLNNFSQDAKAFDKHQLSTFQMLLESFLASCEHLSSNAFHSTQGRFSPMIFESVFVAVCRNAYAKSKSVEGKIIPDSLDCLKNNPMFQGATQSQTTSRVNVKRRLEMARDILATS